MATEQEELKLVVSLDDQATGKLDQIKKSWSLGDEVNKFTENFKRSFETARVAAEENYKKSIGAVNQQHEKTKNALVAIGGEHQKISRLQDEHQGKVLQTTENFLRLNSVAQGYNLTLAGTVGTTISLVRAGQNFGSAFGAARLAVGGLAIGLVAVGAATAGVLKALYDYSGRQVEKAHTAARTGVDSATQQRIIDSFALGGKSREAALATIGSAADVQAQLAIPDSPTRRGLLERLQGRPRERQMERLSALANAPNMATYLTEAFAQGQEVYQGRYAASIRAGQSPAEAEARAKALQRSHLERVGAGALADFSEEEFRSLNLKPPTKEEQDKAKQENIEAIRARYELSKVQVAFGTTIDKFSAKLLPVVTDALAPLSQGFSKWADALKPEDYQKFADAISTAATAIGTAVTGLAGMDWSGVTTFMSATVAEIKTAVSYGEIVADKLNAAQSLYARSLPASARTAAQQEQVDQYNEQHGRFVAKQQAEAIAKDPKALMGLAVGAPSLARQLGERGVDEPAPGFNYGSTSAADPLKRGVSWLAHGIVHPTKETSDIMEAQAEKTRQLELEDSRLKGEPVFATQRIPPTIPPMSQQAPVGLGYTPPPGQPTFATYDRDKSRTLIEEQNKALEDLTAELRTLNGKTPFDTAGPRDTMAESLGASDIGKPYRSRLFNQAMPEDLIKLETPPTREGYPSLAELTGERGRERGGIDREPLYTAMQREMTHRIEGNSKLTVDISAPPGTSIDADGGDLFAHTEINRQVVMEPAATTKQRSPLFR